MHTDTDRRTVIAGTGLLALLAAQPAVAAGKDAELIRLGALLDAAWSEQAACEAAGLDIDEPYDRVKAVVDQIEDLPAASLAGLIVKTRACSWCHGGEPFDPDFFGGETTDERLAASICRDLLALSGRPVPFIA